MPTTVPVRDLKDTAAFASLVENEREVTVTKNGYDVMYCTSTEQHRIDQEKLAKADILSRILLAEEEISSGRFEDYDSFVERIRKSYGL